VVFTDLQPAKLQIATSCKHGLEEIQTADNATNGFPYGCSVEGHAINHGSNKSDLTIDERYH